MDVDIRVHGGAIQSSTGSCRGDVLIKGEQVVGIVAWDHPVPAKSQIDATGKYVFPGLIDLHAHTRQPGYEYKEDFLTCSQAAAAGGFTAIADMPNVEPPTTIAALFEEKRKVAEKSFITDWGHLVSPTDPNEVPRFAAAGVTGFKIFQVSGGYPHDPRLAMGDPAQIYAAFSRIAKTGLHCSVHPCSQTLMDQMTADTLAAGAPHSMETFSKLYTEDVIWSSAVAVLLELQRVTGVRMQCLHTHSATSLKMIRAAKARGQRVTAAIDPKYYHLTMQDLAEQGGRAAPGGFVTEDAARMDAIWRSLNDGTIDAIDNDHAPHSLEALEGVRKDPWHGPWGNPQYDYILSLILTDVHAKKMDLASVVRLMSESSAKLIGIYPRKGALQVGSDADLVIVDLDAEVIATDEATYTKCHWTPYRGRRLKGKPVLTMRRGEVIAKDGKVVGRPGTGRYISGVPQA